MILEIVIVLSVLGAGILIGYQLNKLKKNTPTAPAILKQENSSLQLQAYERLIIFSNRIALTQLITRIDGTGLDAKGWQYLLTQTIRQEFEHNITQQIYVSLDAWAAVQQLKEETILIINQLGSTMENNDDISELNKLIAYYIANNPDKATLSENVLRILNTEAKKIL
ncbi:MAG: hypothetical protein QM528_09295 [Phycisphaerales bacterium]|nr:hypothetical protein [Phycisphaerales bacterium]